MKSHRLVMCQLKRSRGNKEMKEESEYIRGNILETATELRELKEYLKENNDEMDETRQRRRDKMVKLVRNLKGLKNDYETNLDLMEEKQSELQRNESKVEYNVDVISNQMHRCTKLLKILANIQIYVR